MAHLVSETYATALFDVGMELRRIEDVHEEFAAVAELIQADAQFFEVLRTPKITKEEKKAIIHAIFDGRLSGMMINFLKVLIDKRRGRDILEIWRTFDKKYNTHLNKATAIVQTVVPLTDVQTTRLTEQLNAITGYKISIDNQIDASLVGGMIIRIGDRMIDNSVKRRIANMKDLLIERVI